jgi:hypothetical protein
MTALGQKETFPCRLPRKFLRAAMVAFEQSRQPSRGARAVSITNLAVSRM